ncbi:hypothetical protein L228DRAFT_260574 [Xylona heveae TC161]|uniref:Transcriptional regulatory protein DEP1 n=1 Tax=Xylona heveae (strain CBS 132557 / TC161) TaxID=1328760 RepID=A0A165HPS6_XYLHT|nr:hypothetical protein L228DRAFT_260574 [Xylona heveae TC161]KZF23812.1 hypothetical protein L228DRAFT_260574 [Xylona heveae TC161]
MSGIGRRSRTRSRPSSGSGSSPAPAEGNETLELPLKALDTAQRAPDESSILSDEAPSPQTDVPMDEAGIPEPELPADIADDLPAFARDDDALEPTISQIDNKDDDRSSSLSDPDEAPENDELLQDESSDESDISDANDSEAETERLHSSPLKERTPHDVVFDPDRSIPASPSKLAHVMTADDTNEEIEAPAKVEDDNVSVSAKSVNDLDDLPSAVTSLADSNIAAGRMPSPPELAGKKRKRLSPHSRSISPEQGNSAEATKKRSIQEEINGNGVVKHDSDIEEEDDEEEEEEAVLPPEEIKKADHEASDEDLDNIQADLGEPKESEESEQEEIPAVAKAPKGRTTRRRAKQAKEDEMEDTEMAEEEAEGRLVANETDMVDESEDIGGIEGETDITARTEEEVMKKKAAMDALGAIEKNFATFRDKLYDERLAQLNNELAMLSDPNCVHPEYLAMMRCIDARRDEKIQLEQTLLAYKLKALQVRSVAERAQIHAQYYQTVREIRERTMEEVGREWYKIQKDRRTWEGSVPEFSYQFPTRRSQQVTQQTAYNLEVSVISGVAKYVGFPAAPELEGARPSEIDADFERMAIKPQARRTNALQNNQMRSAASTPSTTRPKPTEEQLLEQAAWANPHQPVHQTAQQPPRPSSHQPHAGGPFTTPAGPRRNTDAPPTNGSVSTVGASTLPASSAAGTPMTGERPNHSNQANGSMFGENISPFPRAGNFASSGGKGTGKHGSPSATRETGEVQYPDSTSNRPPHDPQSESRRRSSNPFDGPFPTSRTGRFGSTSGTQETPAVKDEEGTERKLMSSPLNHHSHGPPGGIAAGTGGPRFGSR